ncbi:MbtH family protein [Streptomyces canus]|uniref:MbtH family protein n=1 Tax=Streptomyces canus TaxID=58343 RepID=UPI00371414D2
MTGNPFDDEGTFLALVNHLGQYSLWPAATAVPAGWRTAHGPGTRSGCLDHVEEHWTALTPGRRSA